MSLRDLLEISLFLSLVVLALLLLAGSVRFRPSRMRGVPWRERLRRFWHYTLVRLPVAIGFGIAIFVLGAAALTLNSHRPPGDNSPKVTVPARTGSGVIEVELAGCEGDLNAVVRTSGRKLGDSGSPRVFSDQDGLHPFPMKSGGPSGQSRGQFTITEPLARRGLLSCYLQLPVLDGAESGYEVHLNLSEEMEVDTTASVPPPQAYTRGEWIWKCPTGQRCPGFVAINYAIEDGTKQVIVLVLASIFGALIALLAGDVLIEWARRRLRKPGSKEE